VLQIVTGKFFRDVELQDYTHRRVLYTNAQFFSQDGIDLPMATLRPSTDMDPVTTLTVDLFERLEAVQRNGEPEFMVATSGDELLADLAFVLSFALNATFSADVDQVRRLVRRTLDDRDRSTPAHILRRTCDPRVFIDDREIDDLLAFVEQLIALNRENFELAMKAIRQVVNACRRAADDPSLASTMAVAALESLSGGVEPPPVTWDRLDPRKRKLIDPSLEGLDEDVRERIRTAILEAERAGATHRFVAFVLGHVLPAYYREQAVDAVRPVSAFHLPKLLSRAYGIRSKNVHILEDMPPEAWSSRAVPTR